ncbi:hypothetical protein KEM48_007936 [Puccinia striiformis f. sp. tritici PST-130]|nr:hypothetical protein KEM48_007936 [Puccinia striiformis f. sp. tritici PST-130]
MKLSNFPGFPMVLLILQLKASLVDSMDCSKAGEKNQHAGCGKYVEQKTIPGHTDAPYWTIDVIPPLGIKILMIASKAKGIQSKHAAVFHPSVDKIRSLLVLI